MSSTCLTAKKQKLSVNGEEAFPRDFYDGNTGKMLVFYCFNVLENRLCKGVPNGFTRPQVPAGSEYALFVTWRKQRGSNLELRGCIGTFTRMRLLEGLREYAITSAVNDTRFDPIAKEELPFLECSISILSSSVDCKDIYDWEVGVHGIQISFQNNGHEKSATYLPEVAKDMGWSHVQTIDSLLRKGGFKSNITIEFRESVRVKKYSSCKIRSTFDEYASHMMQQTSDH